MRAAKDIGLSIPEEFLLLAMIIDMDQYTIPRSHRLIRTAQLGHDMMKRLLKIKALP